MENSKTRRTAARAARSAVAVAVAATAFFSLGGQALAEGDNTLAADGDRYTWTGTAPVPVNPAPNQPPTASCLDPAAPVCDHEQIEIVAGESFFHVVIGISADVDPADDYDLYVYDDRGELVGSSASPGSDEQVELFNPRSGTYDVAVLAYEVGTDSTYSGTAEYIAGGADHGPYDLFEDDCLEAVPVKLGPPAVVDIGQRVELDVLVLLDGVSVADARAHMLDANRSYADIGIDIVATYQEITVPSDGVYEGRPTAEGIAVNQFSRALLGGGRPPGIDVVYTLTAKDLWSANGAARSYGLLGVADCLGGVRFGHRAFATGEITSIDGPVFQGFELFPIRGYRTTAHEIGHLMGAHHHYFNCIEGIPTEADEGEFSPCTIMAPYVDLQSDNFGQLEAAVIRGHALAYAADDAPEPVVPESPLGTAGLAAAGAAVIAFLLHRGRRAPVAA